MDLIFPISNHHSIYCRWKKGSLEPSLTGKSGICLGMALAYLKASIENAPYIVARRDVLMSDVHMAVISASYMKCHMYGIEPYTPALVKIRILLGSQGLYLGNNYEVGSFSLLEVASWMADTEGHYCILIDHIKGGHHMMSGQSNHRRDFWELFDPNEGLMRTDWEGQFSSCKERFREEVFDYLLEKYYSQGFGSEVCYLCPVSGTEPTEPDKKKAGF